MTSKSERKEKVIVLTSTFPLEKNKEHFVYDLCQRYKESFEVYVIAPSITHESFEEDYNGIHVYRHMVTPFGDFGLCYKDGMPSNLRRKPWRFFVIPFLLLGQVLALHKLISKESIKLVHAQWMIPSGFSAAFYKKFLNKNIKILCTARGSDSNLFTGLIFNIFKKFALSYSNYVVTVSGILKDKIRELGYKGPVDVYPTGINVDIFVPKKKISDIETNNILFTGSIVETKGVRFLLIAFKDLLHRLPSAKLTLVGSGSLLEELVTLAESWGIASHVEFVGHVLNSKLPSYYAQADVFVLPSFAEGFSVSVSEALACGLPCVTSNLPVFQAISQEHSFLKTVNPKDSTALTNTLYDVLADKSLRQNALIEARNYAVKNLNKENTNIAYINILRGLLLH